MNDNEVSDQFLHLPLYGYSEADYLAGVTRGTARRWLAGYEYKKSGSKRVRRPPVTPESGREEGGVSFIDLVEVVAIGGLKSFGYTLGQIRTIVINTQDILNVQRPLTTEIFKLDGHDAFVQAGGKLVNVLHSKGQRAWDEVLWPFLETLDYSEHHRLARRWWPLGRHKLVVIDPEYAFGLPVIADSGIRTEIIFERWNVGESTQEIAEDFNISPSQIDEALRFEVDRAMKRAA